MKQKILFYMWNKCKAQLGVTLIELLVYITILLMLMTMGYEYITKGFVATTFSSEQEEAIDNARKAIEKISEELRGANESENGSYPIDFFDENEIVFYSDINDDDSMEKIRYYIAGNQLKRDLTASGPSDDYSGTAETSLVASYINNQSEPFFYYYDNNGTQTDIKNNIRMIGINIKVNVTPDRAPNDYYVETNIHLRNLKDNL